MPTGQFTARGKTAYYWCSRWPGEELTIGGLKTRVERASLLVGGGKLKVKQTGDRLVLRGLPKGCPDRIAGVEIIKLECRSRIRQVLGAGCVMR